MYLKGFCQPHFVPILTSFLDGAVRHGHTFKIFPAASLDLEKENWKDCDCVVTIGWTGTHIPKVHSDCKKRGVPCVSIADGYVTVPGTKRYGDTYHFSVNLWGIHGYATHHFERDLPSDRWEKLCFKVKPWRDSPGEYAIIAHQGFTKFWYNVVDNGNSRQDIYRKIAQDLLDKGWKVVVCPHPRGKYQDGRPEQKILSEFRDLGFEIASRRELLKRLPAAICVATHDSNSVSEAVINGIPAVAYGKTIATPMLSPDFNDLRKPEGRQEWCNWAAYQQYKTDEMRQGLAWDYIMAKHPSHRKEVAA